MPDEVHDAQWYINQAETELDRERDAGRFAGSSPEGRARNVARAQVYATLALTAATLETSRRDS